MRDREREREREREGERKRKEGGVVPSVCVRVRESWGCEIKNVCACESA